MIVPTRIKVNLITREFEIEGNPEFINDYYAKISGLLTDNTAVAVNPNSSDMGSKNPPRRNPKAAPSPVANEGTKPQPKSKGGGQVVKLNPSLNLRGDKNIQSFADFVKEKNPNKGPEFNTLSIYYLEDLMGLNPVTLSDAYTCYKEVGQRPTANFKQAFIDTKNKKAWIEVDDDGNLSLTARGRILVEHDLPHPSTKT